MIDMKSRDKYCDAELESTESPCKNHVLGNTYDLLIAFTS